MNQWQRPRKSTSARLVMRIYGVALLAFLATVLVFIAFALLVPDPPGSPRKRLRFFVETALPLRDDPAILDRLLHNMRDQAGVELTLYRRNGQLLASNRAVPHAPLSTEQLEQLEVAGDLALGTPPVWAIQPRLGAPQGALREDHPYAITSMRLGPRAGLHLIPPLLLILVAIGVLTFFLARSIARPLGHLTETARAFGDGKLASRAHLERQDEFGDLGRTFNEMADRIEGLLQAQRELLANVSHELRTPLARIRVALDLAGLDRPVEEQESLAEIAEDLDELERLVGDIITAGRLDVHNRDPAVPPLRLEPVQSEVLVQAAAARFRRAHPQHLLALELDADLPELKADPVLLRRAVDNLLDNAGKYSEPGSRVTLRAGMAGSSLEIAVVDRGMGIAPNNLKAVFDPFFRGETSRARSTGGVGLGLTLARRIVNAHNGEIRVQSSPERGTTVLLTLPLANMHR